MNSDSLKHVLHELVGRALLERRARELSLPVHSGTVIGLCGVRPIAAQGRGRLLRHEHGPETAQWFPGARPAWRRLLEQGKEER